MLAKLSKKMGKAFYFNFWNPNGHYELNLGNPIERDIAVTLVVFNKEQSKRIINGERADRSQSGNKSCFRNEKMNGQIFQMQSDWILPHNGLLEFDFVHVNDRPTPEEVI